MSNDPESAPKTVRLSGAALAAAVVVLIAFGAFVVFMLSETGTSELRWTRAAWLFASVEAIAFGAAGALFGSSIQRARAENAEAEARRSAKDAANGRALASVVLADDEKQDGGLEALGPADQRTAALSHAAVARKLFPGLAEERS